MSKLEVKLNGKNKKIEKNSTLKDLLPTLNPDTIVTEVNLEIIKKDKRKDFILKNGDCVEIITFMGGG